MDIQNLKESIKKISKEQGFEQVAFLSLSEVDAKNREEFIKWLKSGYHASMSYMENNIDLRFDVSKLFEGYKSMIILGLNYFQEVKEDGIGKNISVYAYGRDYHKTIKSKLKRIIKFLNENGVNARGFTDSAPIMEKYFAKLAGMGWQGRNSLIINKKFGSYFFLAEILTDFDFREQANILPNHCGNCRRCIEACPTDAIVDDGVVDSNRCISYLTIENKEKIKKEIDDKIGNWIFGCDICQQVCPWNRKAIITKEADFGFRYKKLTLKDILSFTEEDFKDYFKGSPIRRADYKVFLGRVKKITE